MSVDAHKSMHGELGEPVGVATEVLNRVVLTGVSAVARFRLMNPLIV